MAKATADRETIFSGVGALGSTIMVVQIDGVDMNTLWQDDKFGEPLQAKGNSDAFASHVFETTPSLNLPKQPDLDNGVIIFDHGEQVSDQAAREHEPEGCKGQYLGLP